MASTVSTWLATLTKDQLAGVLSRRTDVLSGPEPRNLSELAERLQRPASVFRALSSLNLPCLQAAEALLALGETSRDGLAELLGADPDDVLAELREHALVWPGSHGTLHVAAAVRDAFPNPLGLGRPARDLLADRTVADLHKLQATLGLPRGGAKRAVIDSITARLGDARFVRERIASLPAQAREYLERRAGRDDEGIVFGVRSDAERLVIDAGLLIAAPWGVQAYLPAEVRRAMHGDGFRATFTPQRPDIRWDAVGVEAIEAEAGVRAADFARRTCSNSRTPSTRTCRCASSTRRRPAATPHASSANCCSTRRSSWAGATCATPSACSPSRASSPQRPSDTPGAGLNYGLG